MANIRRIAGEIFGLFVDDGWFALAQLAWLAAAGAALRSGAVSPGWGGPLLFAGLASLLVWSVRRRAARA